MRALEFPFRVGTDGSLATTADYAQIVRGQVIDALMTNLGERKMRPRYGCDLQAALFDPSEELERSDAAGILKGKLSALVPRALVRSVRVDVPAPGKTTNFIGQSGGEGEVVISILYRPTPYAEDVNLAVPVASEYLNRQRTGVIR
jgi:phage baseplate assembly protein W